MALLLDFSVLSPVELLTIYLFLSVIILSLSRYVKHVEVFLQTVESEELESHNMHLLYCCDHGK